jgi:hypothetical protein
MNRYDGVFTFLALVFVSSLILANSLVFKLFDVPLPLVGTATLSAGILPYPVTFLVTDLVSELYGRKRANQLVWLGFAMSLYMLVLLQIGKWVPLSAMQSPEIQGHYLAVFGQSARAILASMVAYLLAQFLDVRLFHFWKSLTHGRHLWLRNNGSTIISQLVDTVAVVSILFVGTLETPALVHVIVSSYVFKLGIALTDTPFFYLGVRLFKSIEEETIRRERT